MVDRRLGRGLDFFLSRGRPAPDATKADPSPRTNVADLKMQGEDEIVQADVTQLVVSPYQPRKAMGEAELKELAESIRASGILQPILARRVGHKLEIVAGERRWRAAQLAGLTRVPVLVRTLTNQESAVFALVENLQREDLNAIEKARGFKLLMATLATTQEEVARRVGLERSSVANFLRLLDLPEAVQAHVSRGTLTMGHARCLLALPDAKAMTEYADECVKQGWSVRETEAKVKLAQAASLGTATKAGGAAKAKGRPVWLNEIEEALVENLGTKVAIRYGRKRSQIVIETAGRAEFERIYARLKEA
ncbi:MAG: ParB/RepB/Spo0J family partition protein [Planctomycetes bacterium]|nr:ParB/RepB/Spo0J family partition protein [Planctomycetota bacterium]